jgi:epoxyqueuosine reductase
MLAERMSLSPTELGTIIVAQARALGFARVGLAAVATAARHDAYVSWLAAGHHGVMVYLATPAAVACRRDVRGLYPAARTVVSVALAYGGEGGARVHLPLVDGPRGVIARYARGDDYHTVMKHKLGQLLAALAPHGVLGQTMADLLPVLERDEAERAALGFVGKNTLLIAPGAGSYLVLGELLLDQLAEVTSEPERKRCGQCRACLDACPTGAFVDAFVLDARRCISYLTIENPGPIPRELRPLMGLHVFGCDICQEVCPFNAGAGSPAAPELAARSAERGAPDLIALLNLGTNQLRQLMARSAMRRAGRAQLRRNVCVALGNAGDARAIPALIRALDDRTALVRAHAAWALGRLGAFDPLEARLAVETDLAVREELGAALHQR